MRRFEQWGQFADALVANINGILALGLIFSGLFHAACTVIMMPYFLVFLISSCAWVLWIMWSLIHRVVCGEYHPAAYHAAAMLVCSGLIIAAQYSFYDQQIGCQYAGRWEQVLMHGIASFCYFFQ
jgi:hypothetical protein